MNDSHPGIAIIDELNRTQHIKKIKKIKKSLLVFVKILKWDCSMIFSPGSY